MVAAALRRCDGPVSEQVKRRHRVRAGVRLRPRGVNTAGNDERPGRRPRRSLWRCRESNPGPPLLREGFSVRSPLCLYSDPPVMRASRCDDPSRCVMSPSTPRPGGRVSPLNDAGFRGGDAPGPTDSHSLRRRERTQCDWCRHLFFCDGWFTRSSSPSSARFPSICVRSRNRSPPCIARVGGRSRVTLPGPGIISEGIPASGGRDQVVDLVDRRRAPSTMPMSSTFCSPSAVAKVVT